MCGLGLRSAVDHSAGVYISSFNASESLRDGLLPHRKVTIDLTSAMAQLSEKLEEEVSNDEIYAMSQKALSLRMDLKLHLNLSNSLTEVRDRARLASLGLPHSGDWLNVIPSPILGLHVRPQEFRMSVLYRLGAPVYSSSGPCPACHKQSDRLGDHALACGTAGERIARHDHLRDALFQTAASANLAPRKEEKGLLPGSISRPADVFIPNWTGGRDTALDVTVVSPLLLTRIEDSAARPGHTLTVAFSDKCRQTHQACEREGIVFIPLPVETLGGWHERAADQIRKLARAAARNSGSEEEEVTRHLFQRLGILLVKGNAALLANRIPSFPSPEVDGLQ